MLARPRSDLFRWLIFASAFAAITASGTSAVAQDLPRSIRGYKVNGERIRLDGTSATNGLTIEFTEPEVADLGLAGLTVQISASILSTVQSAKIESVLFNEFRIDGIPVKIEDYESAFEIRRNETVVLPRPARIFVSTERMIQAAWREFSDSREQWRVTGRAFVFGKFRKLGFYHKRVVPVDIDVLISNPLRRE